MGLLKDFIKSLAIHFSLFARSEWFLWRNAVSCGESVRGSVLKLHHCAVLFPCGVSETIK